MKLPTSKLMSPLNRYGQSRHYKELDPHMKNMSPRDINNKLCCPQKRGKKKEKKKRDYVDRESNYQLNKI